MNKKYIPYIVLLAAALLLWYVKKNQRGSFNRPPSVDMTVPATENQPFNRNIGNISYSKHARCRMACRHIDESEVQEILKDGKLNERKVESDERGTTYPLEGVTHDQQHVRIVFAPKAREIVVVTVIDLDKEWPCDCK